MLRHYVDYLSSAQEQGIATYGAGDEARENARGLHQYFPASSELSILVSFPDDFFCTCNFFKLISFGSSIIPNFQSL